MDLEEKFSGVSHSELVRMRGEIVSGLANIESGICKCISAYFIDPKLENPKWLEFNFELLYHDYLNFKIRIDVFKKICERKGIKDFPFDKLLQMQRIRNKFAHSWTVNFTDNTMDLFLLGEFWGKSAETLYQEYKNLKVKVEESLLAIVKKEPWSGKV